MATFNDQVMQAIDAINAVAGSVHTDACARYEALREINQYTHMRATAIQSEIDAQKDRAANEGVHA